MDLVQQFMSISGLSEEESKNYLMMTGNDLDLAVSLFFEQDDQNIQNGQQFQVEENDYPIYKEVFWGKNDIPDSWSEQGFKIHKLGFQQEKNGPCGPLVFVNAVLISQIIHNSDFDENYVIQDKDLAKALISIIQLQSKSQYTIFIGENDFYSFQYIEEAHKYLLQNIEKFKNPGGLNLFLYSIAQTKGVEQIKKELKNIDSQGLIFPPFFSSGVELLSMMLTGYIQRNLDDYNYQTLQKQTFSNPFQVGILSKQQIEIKIPISDDFFVPKNHIWIVHGGDHYTLLFSLEDIQQQNCVLHHFNGLKPLGPRLCKFNIQFKKFINKNILPQDNKQKNQYFKPIKGEIDSVIQVIQSDKKQFPKEQFLLFRYKKWRYEVALSIEDPSVQGEIRKDISKIQTFDQGPNQEGPWRCLQCYNKRFQTYNFGQNEGGQICSHCQKQKKECGWSIVLNFDQLPQKYQREQEIQHGMKILQVLDIIWKNVSIQMIGDQTPPSI